MKRREFFGVDYMFTRNRDELKDMYKEVRQAYPDNILSFEKKGKTYFIIVNDFVFVEDF